MLNKQIMLTQLSSFLLLFLLIFALLLLLQKEKSWKNVKFNKNTDFCCLSSKNLISTKRKYFSNSRNQIVAKSCQSQKNYTCEIKYAQGSLKQFVLRIIMYEVPEPFGSRRFFGVLRFSPSLRKFMTFKMWKAPFERKIFWFSLFGKVEAIFSDILSFFSWSCSPFVQFFSQPLESLSSRNIWFWPIHKS